MSKGTAFWAPSFWLVAVGFDVVAAGQCAVAVVVAAAVAAELERFRAQLESNALRCCLLWSAVKERERRLVPGL